MVGTIVGSYRVLQQIGEGGMGRVYLAEHELIGKRAAIKVLLPEYSSNATVVNRFFNEARASSLLKHAGVVDIYDFGKLADGAAYIVMEFLEGESVSARLRRERALAVDLVIDIARQIASALSAAHARGIIHRDLKPDNIFLVPDSETRSGLRAKVLDFGIAKLSDSDTLPGASSATRTGAIIGTPTYMSPEQCRGAGKVDHRADIYALGCVMFEMAAGRPPFVGEGPGDVLAAHLFHEPESLHGLLPEALAATIGRMLTKDPLGRPQTMTEVVAALTTHATDPTGLSSHRPIDPSRTLVSEVAARADASTTLGGAAGEVGAPQPSSSRKMRWVAIATVVAGAGAAALVIGQRPSTPPSKSPPVAAAAAIPAPSVAAPAAAPPAAPSAAEPAAAAPAPKTVHISLDSRPRGADVIRASDSSHLGRTPVEVRMEESAGEALFQLKLSGFQDTSASVPLDRDGARTIVLQKTAHHGHAAPPAAGEKPSSEKKPSKNGVVDPFDN